MISSLLHELVGLRPQVYYTLAKFNLKFNLPPPLNTPMNLVHPICTSVDFRDHLIFKNHNCEPYCIMLLYYDRVRVCKNHGYIDKNCII